MARKKGRCKLIGNRLVIPHDTIPSTVGGNNEKLTSMQKENIHIVFGRVGRKTLIDSNVIDVNKSQILSFDDILNTGPACDINANEDIQKRINWLQKVYGANPIPPVEQDLKSIEAIIKNVHNINRVFIWTGYCASEMISTARVVYHLSKFEKPISIANFNTPVRSIHGDIIYPKALYQTATFQVKDIFNQFELIDKNRLEDYISLWEEVKSGNGELWIYDKNGQINVEKTDYFDSHLLSHCNENFQKAARVIGETLVDTDFNVGDSYLNWRLKQLSLNGKIETQGKLIEIRDYEVKKITTANTRYKKLPGQ